MAAQLHVLQAYSELDLFRNDPDRDRYAKYFIALVTNSKWRRRRQYRGGERRAAEEPPAKH